MHQFVNQFIVSRTTLALLPQPDVKLIIQKVLIKKNRHKKDGKEEMSSENEGGKNVQRTSLSVPTSNIMGRHLKEYMLVWALYDEANEKENQKNWTERAKWSRKNSKIK